MVIYNYFIDIPLKKKRKIYTQNPSTVIHKEDDLRKGYYFCIFSLKKGTPEKMSNDLNKVTCKACLKQIKFQKLKSEY